MRASRPYISKLDQRARIYVVNLPLTVDIIDRGRVVDAEYPLYGASIRFRIDRVYERFDFIIEAVFLIKNTERVC